MKRSEITQRIVTLDAPSGKPYGFVVQEDGGPRGLPSYRAFVASGFRWIKGVDNVSASGFWGSNPEKPETITVAMSSLPQEIQDWLNPPAIAHDR